MVFVSPAHTFDYNSLESVEEADRIFRSRANADEFLDRAGEILVRAGLDELVAVRLLHKHNDISANEIMLERFETSEEHGETVVTQRTSLGDADQVCTPCIWKCLDNGEILALEFTTKDMENIHPAFFEEHRNVFAAFHALATEFLALRIRLDSH